MALDTVRSVAELRTRMQDWRDDGATIGFVPTMGALHDGHLSLIRMAAQRADRVLATIFVNPKQFGPREDYATYPRDEEADKQLLEAEGADLLFAPDVEAMYPKGFATSVSVEGLGDTLEGEFRPGFFVGVATVVSKLLLQALPDVAVFGEKDYQQLQVIKRMVQDLEIPVVIMGGATVREPDGLALSSRNAYLTPDERAAAPALYRTLTAIANKARAGEDAIGLEAWGADQLELAGFGEINYIAVRDAENLGPWTPGTPGRVLGAAWLGKARLIDNVAV